MTSLFSVFSAETTAVDSLLSCNFKWKLTTIKYWLLFCTIRLNELSIYSVNNRNFFFKKMLSVCVISYYTAIWYTVYEEWKYRIICKSNIFQ